MTGAPTCWHDGTSPSDLFISSLRGRIQRPQGKGVVEIMQGDDWLISCALTATRLRGHDRQSTQRSRVPGITVLTKT